MFGLSRKEKVAKQTKKQAELTDFAKAMDMASDQNYVFWRRSGWSRIYLYGKRVGITADPWKGEKSLDPDTFVGKLTVDNLGKMIQAVQEGYVPVKIKFNEVKQLWYYEVV